MDESLNNFRNLRRWWLWTAVLVFILVDLFVGFDLYFSEMKHNNDGLDILGTSLVAGMILAIPAAFAAGLIVWSIQKFMRLPSGPA